MDADTTPIELHMEALERQGWWIRARIVYLTHDTCYDPKRWRIEAWRPGLPVVLSVTRPTAHEAYIALLLEIEKCRTPLGQ